MRKLCAFLFSDVYGKQELLFPPAILYPPLITLRSYLRLRTLIENGPPLEVKGLTWAVL